MNLTNESSVAVIAAHPDDVKNCTGVILRALGAGARVSVIQMTNGENLGGSHTRDRALSMGGTRKDELLAYLSEIGVLRRHVFLIGIPNTSAYMLEALRDDFYEQEGHPFLDPVLGSDRVIYEDAVQPGMPFFGEAVVEALASLLVAAAPTQVLTHHPKDDHRDHRATAFFASRAVAKASVADARAAHPDVYAFMVYYRRLNWPPEGETLLTSVVERHDLGATPLRFALTDSERERKTTACNSAFVPTLSADYIASYMKRDELFWQLT